MSKLRLLTAKEIQERVLPDYGEWILDPEEREKYKLVDKALKAQLAQDKEQLMNKTQTG